MHHFRALKATINHDTKRIIFRDSERTVCNQSFAEYDCWNVFIYADQAVHYHLLHDETLSVSLYEATLLRNGQIKTNMDSEYHIEFTEIGTRPVVTTA